MWPGQHSCMVAETKKRITQRALSVTPRALSVTQRALSDTQRELLVSPSELSASPSELLASRVRVSTSTACRGLQVSVLTASSALHY